MALKLITAPAEKPVTLAAAKLHCKVDVTDDDTLLTALIAAATEQAEHRTSRALITQTWELALDAFPAVEIELPLIPAASITSIKYLDAAGVEQTINNLEYGLDTYDSQRHWVIPASDFAWPGTYNAANAVKVRYVAGFGDAAAVPDSIKQWILLAVGAWYANREAIAQNESYALPHGCLDGLLDPYRVYRL